MRTDLMAALFGAAAALLAMTARAQLVATDNGLGVYDTVHNVTWTSNASLFATQLASYTNGSCGAAGSIACENAFVSAVIAASGGAIHDAPNRFDPSGTGRWSCRNRLSTIEEDRFSEKKSLRLLLVGSGCSLPGAGRSPFTRTSYGTTPGLLPSVIWPSPWPQPLRPREARRRSPRHPT
jgi:hypothetical protein